MDTTMRPRVTKTRTTPTPKAPWDLHCPTCRITVRFVRWGHAVDVAVDHQSRHLRADRLQAAFDKQLAVVRRLDPRWTKPTNDTKETS